MKHYLRSTGSPWLPELVRFQKFIQKLFTDLICPRMQCHKAGSFPDETAYFSTRSSSLSSRSKKLGGSGGEHGNSHSLARYSNVLDQRKSLGSILPSQTPPLRAPLFSSFLAPSPPHTKSCSIHPGPGHCHKFYTLK